MNRATKTKKFALLAPRNLQLTEFVLFSECLEIANRLMDSCAFEYETIWVNDCASNCESEARSLPNWPEGRSEQFDAIVVFGANTVLDKSSPRTLSWLRCQARHGVLIGSIANGIFTLARSGILVGKKVTLPRQTEAAFRENFPDIEIVENNHLIDDCLFTCCGGVATIDLAVRIVASFYGPEVAEYVADSFVYDLWARQAQQKETSLERRLSHASPQTYAAVKLMKGNIETPLPIKLVAKKSNISVRQLERKFSSLVATTPRKFYMGLRLSRARSLLLETNLSVTEISQACGFRSLTHFSLSYRSQFRNNPSDERCKVRTIETTKNHDVVKSLVKSRTSSDKHSIYPPSFLPSANPGTSLRKFPPTL